MKETDTLNQAIRALDYSLVARTNLNTYYDGKQPLAFLAPEARTALGDRFGLMSSNLPRVAVNAVSERLRITGFSHPDEATADALWADWRRCDMDQLASMAHREALAVAEAFIIVWADAQGNPTVTVESGDQVAVLRDPVTRETVAAVKRWETSKETFATLFLATEVVRYRSGQKGATTGFTAIDSVPNPLGVVPVVALRNEDRVGRAPVSEITDLIPLVDAQNKLLADMMVASEYAGRPRRWATGVELEERPVLDKNGTPVVEDGEPVMELTNPYPEGSRMMVSEVEGAKFGQLDPAKLDGYESAVRVIQAQISAVTGLPPHYLGVHGDQPASADALRASEAALVAKVCSRQAVFGRAWEMVARLIVAVRTGAPVATIPVSVQWADAGTRSVAQEADAVVKLHQAGILPADYALERLGYTPEDIAAIRKIRVIEQATRLEVPSA